MDYLGEHKGPGWSLLQCKSHLRCPFIYSACDTIVLDNIPSPVLNWIGVSEVKEKEPYLTVSTYNGLVNKVYDKGDLEATYLASIGLVGVS